jgi:ATP-binding cassette subfamily C protein
MFSAVGKAIRFMTPWEKIRFFVFLAMRALVAIFDLIGILAIGYLATSMALFLTEGSDPGRVLSVGALTFPAVSAQTLPYLALAILALFIAKALASVFLTYRLAFLLAGIEARSARTIAENAFGRGLQGSRQNSREDILFAVQSGSPSAFNGLLNSTGTLVAEAFLFILVISAFAVVNPFIAIGAIVYFGVIGFLIQFFIGRLMEKSGRKITSATVEANSGLSDIGDVMREVATTGRLGYFYERVYRSRLNAAGNYATQFVLSGMPRYIVETSLIVAIAVFILIQSLSGDISSSAATVGIFLSGGLRLTASLFSVKSVAA